MTRGFVVGRFQPFHGGHRALVDHVVEDVDELVVGVGSADVSHTTHDPFTAGERVLMVSRAVDHLDVPTYVVPIQDIDRNAVWAGHVRSMVPPLDVVYTNNPLVVRLFEEESGVAVRQSPMFDRDRFEGTDIRRAMVAGDPWRDRVPDPVVDVIKEVDGADRLRTVAGDDAAEN